MDRGIVTYPTENLLSSFCLKKIVVNLTLYKRYFVYYHHIMISLPRPSSSSFSSPSSSNFKNRTWSSSFLFFNQKLYAGTTPRISMIEAKAPRKTTTAMCFLRSPEELETAEQEYR